MSETFDPNLPILIETRFSDVKERLEAIQEKFEDVEIVHFSQVQKLLKEELLKEDLIKNPFNVMTVVQPYLLMAYHLGLEEGRVPVKRILAYIEDEAPDYKETIEHKDLVISDLVKRNTILKDKISMMID